MSFTIIVSLLQAAITLLTLVQSNPALPQSTRDNVMQVVQQAITTATTALSTNTQTTTTSCPTYNIPSCPAGQHVQSGTVNANGCPGPSSCVANTSCPVYNACPTGYTTNTSTDASGCTVIQCTNPTTSSNFSASPTSGNSPLAVSFTAPYGEIIDFGDGQIAHTGNGSCLTSGTCPIASVPHTYASTGTYTAKLTTDPVLVAHCTVSTDCPSLPAPVVLATLTITVTGSSQSNFSAFPTSGNSPLAVTFTANTNGTFV